jgi:hypothetical protein
MMSMIFNGDEEQLLFPKILRSGFLNEVEKKQPFLLLRSEFSNSPGPGGTLSSKVGCCSMAEQIVRLEQCFDEMTIALIGSQIVSITTVSTSYVVEGA